MFRGRLRSAGGGRESSRLSAFRALWESRSAAVAFAECDGPSLSSLEKLRRMPFPALEGRYAEQLEILYRRREATDVVRVERELDWAIERVAAELYGVGLQTLIWLQERASEHSAGD